MSPPPEEMMSWMLEELGLSGTEGISIKSLFAGINEHLSATSQLPLDVRTREALWKSLLAREDVGFGDETKRAVLRILKYQDVLALAYGNEKVKLRNAITPPASNGVVQPAERDQSFLSAAHSSSSIPKPLISSIQENSTAANRASLAPAEATPAVSHGATPAPKRRGRPPKGSKVPNAKPVEQRTTRKRVTKPQVAAQVEADRNADVSEYINPPEPERPETSGHQSAEPKPRRTRGNKVTAPQPMNSVFESLNLTDPHFLRNRLGSWKPAYDATTKEMESSKPNGGGHEDDRALDPSNNTLESTSDQAENRISGTPEAPTPKTTSNKRKVDHILDANSLNIDGGPLKKLAGLGNSISPLTSSPFAEAAAVPLNLQTTDTGVGHQQEYQTMSQVQESSSDGQQPHSAPQPPKQTVHALQDRPQPFSSRPLETDSAYRHDYQTHQQIVSQHYSSQHGDSSPIPPPSQAYRPDMRSRLSSMQASVSEIHQQQNPFQAATPLPFVAPSPQHIVLTSVVKPTYGKARISKAYIEAAESFWKGQRLDELKVECRRHGLRILGTKSNLIARLRNAFFELDESKSATATQQPTVPQSIILPSTRQLSNEQIPLVRASGFGPRPASQKSDAQRSTPTPQKGILDRPTQATSNTYRSPYARVESPAKKSSQSMRWSSIEDGVDQPQQKEAQSQKDELGPANEMVGGPLIHSVPIPASNEAMSLLPSVEGLDALLQAQTTGFSKQSLELSPVAIHSQNASIEPQKTIAPEAQPVASQLPIAKLPMSTPVHVTAPAQQTTEIRQSGIRNTEQSFIDQFRRPTAPTPHASSQFQPSGPKSPRSLDHGKSSSEPMQEPLPQLHQQMHPSHNQGQGYGYHHGRTPEKVDLDVHMGIEHPYNAQQHVLHPQPASITSVRSNTGGYPPPSYLLLAQATAHGQMPHQAQPWNGPPYQSPDPGQSYNLAQPQRAQSPQRAQELVPNLSGPPRGYFPSAPSRRDFPPLKPMPSTISLPQKRKRSPKNPPSGSSAGPDVDTQSTPRTPHKSSRIVEIEAMEESLERFSAEAKAIELPDITARLFVSYNKVFGNLVLSLDRTLLTFRALTQKPGELSMLSLQINQVKEDPNVSRKKSRPMELRLKYDNDEGNEVLRRFYFGQTESAYEAANEMRAAIAKARTISRAVAGQIDGKDVVIDEDVLNIEVLKPFTCETCPKRFKNREGIKYHLERSNTTCNPNFDPSTKPRKPAKEAKTKKARIKKIPAKRAGQEEGGERSAKRAKKVDFDRDESDVDTSDVVQDVVSDEAADSDSNSDDSIFAWAEKVAFTNPGTIVKSTPPTPRKVVLKIPTSKVTAEEKILSELIENSINSAEADEIVDAAVEAVLGDVVEEAVNFTLLEARIQVAATNSEDLKRQPELQDEAMLDQIRIKRSKDIIMDLVNGNSGMFPGDEALWMAFVGLWLRKHPRFGALPSSKLCGEALDQLLQAGTLILINFPARDDHYMAPTRSIITLQTTPLEGTIVEKLKELIQVAYPRSYVPSKFAPSITILEKLQNLMHGSLQLRPVKSPKKRRDYSKLAAVSLEDPDYESAAEEAVSLFDEDNIGFFEEDDGDSDDEYVDEIVWPKKRDASKSTRSNSLGKTYAHAAAGDTDTSIDSRSMSRSLGEDDFLDASSTQRIKSRARTSTSRLGRPKAKTRAWKGGPVPPEEKERRSYLRANRLMTSSPRVLQNTETGAWGEAPLHVKPSRQRILKPQLPEPITYLQSENGAWDTRAYGHGVRPIFARPARRTDGNPNTEIYLKKLSQGFRPVLLPPENAIRKYFPHPPSKALLRTGKLPQKRKRSKSKVTDVEAGDEYEDEYQLEPTTRRTKRNSTSVAWEGDAVEQPAKRRRTKVAKAAAELQPLFEDNLDVDPDFQANVVLPLSTTSTPRVTRTAMRGFQEDGIQKLEFMKPRTIDDFEKFPNPGLVSLPTSFWATNAKVGEQPLAVNEATSSSNAFSYGPPPGPKGFETVAGWEQGPARETITRGKGGKIIGWISHTVDNFEPSFDTEIMKLKWSDTTAFKIEDLPYEALDDTEEVEPVLEARQANTEPAGPPAKRQRKMATAKGLKKNGLRRRRLTALPSDFDGIVNSLDDVRKDFDVELAPQTVLYNRNENTMTGEEEARLIVAVIVIMTLTGGVEKSVDWVLVSGLFPQYAAHYLKKAWGKIVKVQKAVMEALAEDFQDAFLVAYESGEVPEIDYDHLVDYDWHNLVEWATKKVYSRKRVAKHILLPGSRKEFKKLYNTKEKNSGVDKNREWYFNPSAATYKRMEVISATAQTLPVQAIRIPKAANETDIDEFTLARSWVRALCLTPQTDFDPDTAHEKLQTLGNDLVAEAKESLVDEKIIRNVNNGRAAPGRPFEPTDLVFSALRHHVTEQQFAQAVAFKKYLDAEFSEGKPCVRSDYMANEGTLMCVTNLQGHGRIELKAVDTPMRKFGLTDGGYETSKIPKERFRINMDIYPSSTYLFDTEIPELLEIADPPQGGEAGEIPLWYGITDQLIPDVWKKVLVGVAGVTAMRAGASVSSLQSTFKPALEDWEIWRLMEWGVTVGMMKRCHEDYEGWTMGEWWWAVVGRFCPVPDE